MTCTLICNFLLIAKILLNLLREHEAVHDQSGKHIADVDYRQDIDEHLHDKRYRQRYHADMESYEHLMGKLFPALYQAFKIEQHYCDKRYQ